jgi:hypothetical protein
MGKREPGESNDDKVATLRAYVEQRPEIWTLIGSAVAHCAPMVHNCYYPYWLS